MPTVGTRKFSYDEEGKLQAKAFTLLEELMDVVEALPEKELQKELSGMLNGMGQKMEEAFSVSEEEVMADEDELLEMANKSRKRSGSISMDDDDEDYLGINNSLKEDEEEDV